jgi:mono/diheme cytochrome c family protein
MRSAPSRRAVPAVALLLVVSIVVAGCGGSSKKSSSRTRTSASTPTTVSISSGTSTSASTGEFIFQQQCSSCHMLAAAKATFGTYGPNLDQLKPSEAAVLAQVTSGGGIMPAFGKEGILSASQIKVVATYVAAVAGK